MLTLLGISISSSSSLKNLESQVLKATSLMRYSIFAGLCLDVSGFKAGQISSGSFGGSNTQRCTDNRQRRPLCTVGSMVPIHGYLLVQTFLIFPPQRVFFYLIFKRLKP